MSTIKHKTRQNVEIYPNKTTSQEFHPPQRYRQIQITFHSVEILKITNNERKIETFHKHRPLALYIFLKQIRRPRILQIFLYARVPHFSPILSLYRNFFPKGLNFKKLTLPLLYLKLVNH